MKIFDHHPPFSEFIKNEIDTLENIANRSHLAYFQDLTATLEIYASRYITKWKKGEATSFDFHASFLVEIQQEIQRVLVGANVKKDFTECSYCILILDKTDNKTVIRKFHFDYALQSIPAHQRVPCYHLQYGGKLSPHMVNDNLDDSKIDRWLSVPRLNFHPMNLALLFDVLLCEFKTPETDSIIQSSEWRSLIFANERFLSANYYKAIAEHLASTAYKNSRLLRDFYYGD